MAAREAAGRVTSALQGAIRLRGLAQGTAVGVAEAPQVLAREHAARGVSPEHARDAHLRLCPEVGGEGLGVVGLALAVPLTLLTAYKIGKVDVAFVTGQMIADVIAVIGSLDVVMGDVDR